MQIIKVDAMGDACPIPVVKAKKAVLNRQNTEDVIEVFVDNTTAVENVLRMFSSYGFNAVSKENGDNNYVITASGGGIVGSDGKNSAQKERVNVVSVSSESGALVVAIGSNRMGSGDETLGKNLMKAFIFALTQQEEVPETMLFFNSGAYLSCEGSAVLEDLRTLSEKGVEILTCGTCLDYYKIKDSLAVGGVTNMYSIVEKMEGAGRLIRL